jgi:hypothetical protein
MLDTAQDGQSDELPGLGRWLFRFRMRCGDVFGAPCGIGSPWISRNLSSQPSDGGESWGSSRAWFCMKKRRV